MSTTLAKLHVIGGEKVVSSRRTKMLGKYSFGLDAGPAGTSCKGQRAPCNSALQRLPASPLLRNKRPLVVDEGVCSIAMMAFGAAAIHSHCYHWSQMPACFCLVSPYAMWDEKLVAAGRCFSSSCCTTFTTQVL